MKINLKNLSILLVLTALSACQTIPVERTSPCACDFEPINNQTEKALS